MTLAADTVFTNGEIHTLTTPDESHEAVAVRDGRIVRVGTEGDVALLTGVETSIVDLDGRVVLPGFVDAHTHMETTGRYRRHGDLSGAKSPADCIETLKEVAEADHEWVQGFGYDESSWSSERYLTREDLDRVSEQRPVVAFREDGHTVSLNTEALARLDLPEADVRTEDGEPTGVVVEDAVATVRAATAPDVAETRDLLEAAQSHAVSVGVTGVHDMVWKSHAPRVYRELAADGDLRVRVRLNYWATHLQALNEVGLLTNTGSDMVRTGAIKIVADGSFGARTAKLSEPYETVDTTGQWVVEPDRLADLIAEADADGFQVAVHAIGDAAVAATLDAFEATDAAARRHRIEHAELVDDALLERFADGGVVASVQPNFLKWAGEGDLYDRRIGDRRQQTNRYADFLAAGIPLAFGSDCMPLDPLFGIERTVTAPTESQRLTTTEALRAYTRGTAYAGFTEEELGTIEAGKRADLTVLGDSPWTVPAEELGEIPVEMTVVDGDVVYDAR